MNRKSQKSIEAKEAAKKADDAVRDMLARRGRHNIMLDAVSRNAQDIVNTASRLRGTSCFPRHDKTLGKAMDALEEIKDSMHAMESHISGRRTKDEDDEE